MQVIPGREWILPGEGDIASGLAMWDMEGGETGGRGQNMDRSRVQLPGEVIAETSRTLRSHANILIRFHFDPTNSSADGMMKHPNTGS